MPMSNHEQGICSKAPVDRTFVSTSNGGFALADGAAHKAIWSSKGDAGTKYCFLCANVHSKPAASPEDQDVIDHYTKYNQLKLTTDDEVLRDEKKRTATTKAEFNFWQQANDMVNQMSSWWMNWRSSWNVP